jgi:hypothetical protein
VVLLEPSWWPCKAVRYLTWGSALYHHRVSRVPRQEFEHHASDRTSTLVSSPLGVAAAATGDTRQAEACHSSGG